MSSLYHHGIKGQSWGVKHGPPYPLSTKTHNRIIKKGEASDDEPKRDKPHRKAPRKASEMTDEELNQMIRRLTLEENYDRLVKNQKERNTGVVKRLVSNALKELGEKALGIGVNKYIEALSNSIVVKDGFDINKWKDTDPYEMDSDTAKKVEAWYKTAVSIKTNRSKLEKPPDKEKKGEKRRKK